MLSGWLWALPTLPEVEASGEKFQLRFQAGDQRGVLEQAKGAPELSYIVLEDWAVRTSAGSPALYTLIARGMQLGGDERGMELLLRRKLVEPTLAQTGPQQLPSVDLSLPLEGVDWKHWGLPVAIRLADLGNYRQALRLAAAYQAYTRQAGLVSDWIELHSALLAIESGQFQLARQRRQQLVSWARAQSEPMEGVYLQAMLLQAAEQAGQPALERELEAELETSLATLPASQRPLFRFVLETHRARDLLRASPEPDWPGLVRQHEVAFAALRSYHPAATGNRLWIRSAAFWATFLNRAQALGVNLEQVTALQLEDFKELQRLASEGIEKDSYAAHLGPLALHLDLLIDRLHLQEPVLKDARKMLDVVEPAFAQEQGWMLEEQAQRQRSMPAALRARLGSDFQLNYLLGEPSLIESRLAVLHLYLLPRQAPPKQLELWLEQAQRGATQASAEMGHLALDDPRWATLDWLSQVRPTQWRERSQRLLSLLWQENQRCYYRPGLIAVWSRRGQIGNDPKALQTAVSLLEEYLNEMGGSAGVRLAYRSTYDLLAKLQLRQGLKQEAMETLARRQNVESVQLGSQALGRTALTASADQLSQQQLALEQQAAVERSLGRESESTQKLLASTRGEFHQVLASMGKLNPNFESVLSVRPANLALWQKLIPANATLVQYFPCDDSLYIFVVTPSQLKIRQVAVKKALLQRSVFRLRRLLAAFPSHPELAHFRWNDPASPGYLSNTKPLEQESRQLYDWLIRPVEGDLGKRPVLALLPSEALHYVPFPALLRSVSPGKAEFVVQRWQCVNLVKAADLSLLIQPPARAQGRQRLLALANPDGTLPGAEREARSIGPTFPGSLIRVGAQATAASLNPLPPTITYLHLATHGHLQTDEPNNSYLTVAGSGDKGKLRISDIYALSLQGVRLVGLSACQTALPEENSGAEVVSLAQAFSVAGGRAVLASLWSVSDEGTEKLMVNFYQQVAAHKSLAESLQKAQLSLLARPDLSHPFYWSAFPLFGDWR